MNNIIYSVIALISITAGAVGFHFITKAKPLPSPEYALHYKEPRALSEFTLTDELGLPFNNQQFEGKWSLVFLGYISCPDVCPMTLQKLSFIYDDLTAIASNSQVLLVTADPKRDTIEKLAQYIAYFNPNFKALRAEHDVLFPFSRNLGLMYAITSKPTVDSPKTVDLSEGVNSSMEVKEEGEESYWVDHSASLVLINPDGKIEAIFKPEQVVGSVPFINSDRLISDFQKIVALYQ